MLRTLLCLFCFGFISQSSLAKTPFTLSQEVFKNADLKFIPHHGKGRFSSYLSMEIQFEPMADLFKQLLLDQRKQMTNRGEAHITVITPIEYFDVLKDKISMAEIDKIAKGKKIQEARFEILCLGRGTAKINEKTEATYFVVVRAPELIEIRQEIHKLFVERKGNPKFFDPKEFYPHITLGFTKRDLHKSDGIVKNKRSCWRKLRME